VGLERIRRQTLLVGLCTTMLLGQAAEAKLGEGISTFAQKMSNAFFLKTQTTKGEVAYLMYTLIGDPNRQKLSPGFGGGVTLTIKEGVISGESLLVRLGDNPKAGKAIAAVLALSVAYEALGKEPPTQAAVQERELNAYLKAIEAALNGSPQTIRYRGFNPKITILSSKTKDVLLTVTPGPKPAPPN
jgi:hypothetical protein